MSSGGGYRLRVALYIAAYVLPAAAIWGVLGVVSRLFNALPVFTLLLAWVYALGFGVCETLALPVRAPSLAWQVPAQWVEKRSAAVQTIIWGAALGPGLITRNPYAGIWLLPLLLALNQNLLIAVGAGIAIGIAHGGARALGVLHNRKCMQTPHGHILILGEQWRWKYLDGLALLLAAGALAAYALSLLGSCL